MLDRAKCMEREGIGNMKKEVMQQIQEKIHSSIETSAVEMVVEKMSIKGLELSENLIDQILNDDDLLILTDDMQDDMILTATIGVLPSEFAMKGDQLLQLDDDVLAKERIWATLVKDTDKVGKDLQIVKTHDEEEVIKFKSPSW